jgi:cation diffusion facilitator CzcD-associated flavoprotein CzcO
MVFGVDENPQTNSTVQVETKWLPQGGPLNSPSRISIVCIGAGVSGIATAVRIQERLTDCGFDIYEKHHDLGSTWLENRSPGCACDVPAAAYTYTFGS